MALALENSEIFSLGNEKCKYYKSFNSRYFSFANAPAMRRIASRILSSDVA